MKARMLLRRAWVAFLMGASFEFLYLGMDTYVGSRVYDFAIAYGLMAAGGAIGIWLDIRITSWNANRKTNQLAAEPQVEPDILVGA